MRTSKQLLLAGLASSALTVSTGHAQELAQSSATSPTVAPDDTGAIVVTGSRIPRRELESAMPVTVMDFDEMAKLGRLNAYDALRLVPALSPGTGAYTSGRSDSQAGAAYLNLRNLGANRTLVLIDGQRQVSGTVTASQVDINMIPAGMIDRMEVVTGGAAAIYGADAVTGAVNIITKKDFQGFRITAQQGISQRGDAPETNISLLAGGKFADDRGSVTIGATYLKTGALLQSDRAFSRNHLSFWPNPANTGPRDGIPDNLSYNEFYLPYNSDVPALYIPNNDTFYTYFQGQLQPLLGKEKLSTGEFARVNGINNPDVIRSYQYYYPMRLGQRTIAGMANFSYDLADWVKFGARFSYGRTQPSGQISLYREDSRTLFAAPFGGAVARIDNPYMPESVRTLLTGFGLTRANISRYYENWPKIEVREDRQTLTTSQNLGGKISNSVSWQVYYQYGRTTQDMTVPNIPRTSRWVAARDVIADPVTGQPVCRDTAARAAGCVPYNLFTSDPMTQAQQDYILTTVRGRSEISQNLFGADLNGTLFQLPAGDVSFAAGVGRRTESATMTGDPQTLSGDARPGGFEGVVPSTNAQGSLGVTEAYGELVVPILRDRPFFRRLEVEGAYRYSDYRDLGDTHTWKAGAMWEPVEGLTIRGTRSRSVRVPNFGELFAPVNTGITGSISDPCLFVNYNATPTRAANCAASGAPTPLANYSDNVIVQSGGNPDLRPEVSNSYTFGTIIQPRFARDLSITVDYWNIEIKDVITTFPLLQMLNYCVDLPTTDNPFCPYVQRGPDGKVTFVSTQNVNAASLSVEGVDIGVNYRLPLGSGRLNFAFNGSYLIQRRIEAVPGEPASIIKYAGGYSDPRFRGYLLTSFDTERYTVSLGTQFISAAKVDPNVSEEFYDDNDIPAMVYNDVQVTRRFDNGLEIGLGIKNLLDTKPPYNPATLYGGGGRYDPIGRTFFARAGLNF
ncbi:TonB-dependent receptor plug domain-containing protein [Polymorphobacter fuscus]|nr:TonB-dependent receptor [Polymorphobacter fuscus]NJC09060.1 outer membrane receptor protein involved in Fe transport [Polymorphobacter fuscus]